MKRNKDITKYKTPSGQVRYKFKVYVGKDEETGNSIQARKQGFKSYDDALKVLTQGMRIKSINSLNFMNCGLLIMS